MSACEVLGLRIRCPKLNKIVLVDRQKGDYAIGPTVGANRCYRIRCRCGDLHVASVRVVTKPTRTQSARSLREKREGKG